MDGLVLRGRMEVAKLTINSKGTSPVTHRNAPLTVEGRRRLIERARESEAENGRVNRDSGEGTAACAGRIRAAESERSSYRRRHVIIVLKSILSRFFDVRIVCSLIG